MVYHYICALCRTGSLESATEANRLTGFEGIVENIVYRDPTESLV